MKKILRLKKEAAGKRSVGLQVPDLLASYQLFKIFFLRVLNSNS